VVTALKHVCCLIDLVRNGMLAIFNSLHSDCSISSHNIGLVGVDPFVYVLLQYIYKWIQTTQSDIAVG